MNDNFDRKLFKERAKEVLFQRKTYWMAFVTTLIASVLGAGWNPLNGGGGGNAGNSANTSTYDDLLYKLQYGSTEEIMEVFIGVVVILAMAFVIATVFIVIGFAVATFFCGHVCVGKNRWYMKNRLDQKPSIGELFFTFGSGSYLNVTKTMFFYYLRIFLWSLLFKIPGYIAFYRYFFVPYILSENPGIDTKRAFEISKYMTDGYKWRIFVTSLSFFGWLLLGMLACCVGMVFVSPYMQATFAEMYEERREMAFATGFCKPSELPGYEV